VFTEEGVVMLATVIKTEAASQISIEIVDAFVTMRKYIGNNLLEQKYITNQVIKNTEDIKLLNASFSKLEEKKKELDIRKYRRQYYNLNLIYDETFHDHYLMIDDKRI